MRALVASLSLALLLSNIAVGQGVQTRMEVTRDGVFPVVTSAPTVPVAGGMLAATNPTPISLRWTYANGASPWITESVAIGNFGTFDWLGENLNGECVSLVGATDNTSPPLPIYEDLASGSSSVDIQVAAADRAPGCAVAWRDSTAGVDEIRYYSGFSTLPATLVAPVQEIRISADGKRIAAGYTDSNNDAAVTVYDAKLVPLITLIGGGGKYFRHHDISGDGSRVLIASGTDNFVYDVATGTLLQQDSTTVSHDAHAIDYDGDTWGRGGFDVGVWKENAGSWSRILSYTDSSMQFAVFTACDLSADGSTFVTSAYDAYNNNAFGVYCWSLTATGAQLLWTYYNTGTGQFQDTPQEVSVSDDGRWIAVGSWGTEFNQHPEVLVFDRNLGNQPVAGIDTPGSCFSVDISGDGQFVVAGTKAVHANTMGNGGEAYSLDLGGQGYWLQGTPSIGRTITLNVNGTAGDLVFLWAGLGLLPAPLTIFPFSGQWWLDTTVLVLKPLPIAPIPAGGTLAMPVALPVTPSAVGVEIFTQVAVSGSSKVIENYLRLAITP